METGKYCAYNVTRNALLSERVVEVKDNLAPEQLLPLLLNGPGMDRREALWMKELAAVIKAPRLFGYEVVYLDDDQRVAEVAAIGPAKEFPALREAVRSVLVLHDRRVTETGTVAGDQVRLCGEAELAALMRTAPQFQEMRPQFEPSQRTVVSQGSADQNFSPEYVFQPFGGSLVYLPGGSTPQANTSEVFLAFKSPEVDVESANSANAEFIELVSLETSTEGIGSDLKGAQAGIAGTLDEPQEEKLPALDVPQIHVSEQVTPPSESDLKEAQAESPTTLPDQAKKKAQDPDFPHFLHPEPIRFFDPVTGSEADDTPGDIAARAAEGSRPSTQLPAELKAAIWRIDEQLRRDKEERKDQGRRREKKQKEKKQKTPNRELIKLFQSPIVDADKRDHGEEAAELLQAAVTSQPVAADAPQVELTPVEFEPVPVEQIQLAPVETSSVEFEPVQAEPVQFEPGHADPAPETASEEVISAKEEITQDVAPPEVPAMVSQSVEAIEEAAETAEIRAEVAPPSEAVIALQSEEIQQIPAEVAPAPVEAIVLQPEEVYEEILENPGEVAPAVVAGNIPEPEEAIEQPFAAIENISAPPPFTSSPLEAAPAIHESIEEQFAEAKVVEDEPVERPSIPRVREIPAGREAPEPVGAAMVARGEPVQEIVEPQLPVTKKPKKKSEKAPEASVAKPSLGTRLQRLLSGESSTLSGNRRRGDRINVPGLVAYYWSGGAPKAHEIVNISRSGFYLRTGDLWLPDTLVKMTLQRPKQEESGAQRRSIGVLARVVRIDENGVGHEFVTTEDLQRRRTMEILPHQGTSRKELQKFLEIK
jgi:uncharacterized membrane protein (UPF0127 family)